MMKDLNHIKIEIEEMAEEKAIPVSKIEELIISPIILIDSSDVGGKAANALTEIYGKLRKLINETKS
jgi:hypothetical protein